MNISGTHIAYYFLCKRKLWLFANHINMEQNSDLVSYGRYISDSTYQKEKHEIKIDSISLDFYDGKRKIIHEIKKSDKMEILHIWQVRYYIFVLESKGIEGVTAIIDYPKLKKRIRVKFEDKSREKLNTIIAEIKDICNSIDTPPIINKPFCKKCSYYELCYIE
ncbi:MAG: CRISPR-associated protein Cas4 [Ignavibacteriaceae bacterium]|nr:CRISPR-associated protein Cas4 [Ignavibacteriaceae bacterium]